MFCLEDLEKCCIHLKKASIGHSLHGLLCDYLAIVLFWDHIFFQLVRNSVNCLIFGSVKYVSRAKLSTFLGLLSSCHWFLMLHTHRWGCLYSLSAKMMEKGIFKFHNDILGLFEWALKASICFVLSLCHTFYLC